MANLKDKSQIEILYVLRDQINDAIKKVEDYEQRYNSSHSSKSGEQGDKE